MVSNKLEPNDAKRVTFGSEGGEGLQRPRPTRPVPMNHRLLRVVLVTLIMLGLLGIADTRPARADCGLGDIICEMQQAIQQLIDNYVGPLKQWAIFQGSVSLFRPS